MRRALVPALVFLVLAGVILSCTSDQETRPSPLGRGFGISSATVLVQNLDSARKYYADVLGFDVPLPEKFENGIFEGTLSAAIRFADMASLELVAIKDTALVSTTHPFVTNFLLQREGVRLYSLSTSSVKATRNDLKAHGFEMDSLRMGRVTRELPKGWNWDDGGPEWLSAGFNNTNPPTHLPNFIEFIGFPYQELEAEWASLHTSWRRYYKHANGVVGLNTLQIVVTDLKAARKEFKKLGLTELESEDKTRARFKVAHNQELHLIAPQSADDELSIFLKANGAGVYALRFVISNFNDTHKYFKEHLPIEALRVDSVAEKLTILKEHALGVQLEFVVEPKEAAALAKIYNFEKGEKLDSSSIKYAAGMYTKYCALCHGKDREGYAADFAPSLRSQSLMATTQASNYLKHVVSYGRPNTAMAAYAKNQGGPLDQVDIELLLQWLYELSGVEKPVDVSTEAIAGDAALGKTLYAKNCATCHGGNGEGVSAPALGNPMLLATASDAFLRYAISEGRDGTPMRAFKDSLSKKEIDALTAYLRSRASGWNVPETVTVAEPLPGEYVINPNNKAPAFTLREGRYASAEQILKAIQDSSRMVILDARSKAAWRQSHIPGAVSVPYYEEPDTFIKNIPNDSTWVVVYCACPHAASERVVSTLKRYGYKHTAILDEGVLVWAQRGYPVQSGRDSKEK